MLGAFRANAVWNTALLQIPGDDPFDLTMAVELRLFSSRRIRRSPKAVHTQADPFLLVEGGWLYLFLEQQRVGSPGFITGHRTKDLVTFEPLGTVLTGDSHLSYPQAFRAPTGVYMLPESVSATEVALYRFDNFPWGLRKDRVLLRGAYADCTIFFRDGLWWLFAFSTSGLELFFASDLGATFERHPIGVITTDSAHARCGGPVLELNGMLYRPAQDCSNRYGGNLSIMRIEELNPTSYRESCARRNIIDQDMPWRALGGHHFSMTKFLGRTIVAIDGQQQDYWINRPISLLQKGASWTTQFVK